MKAILFITVLFFFLVGAVIMFNEPEMLAQEGNTIKVPNVEDDFDRKMKQVEEKLDRAEEVKIVPKLRSIVRYRTAKLALQQINYAVIITDSAVYTVPARIHKGVAIIDGAALQAEISADQDTLIADLPVMVDTMIEEVNNHISAWQQVKNFITKPFKKNK